MRTLLFVAFISTCLRSVGMLNWDSWSVKVTTPWPDAESEQWIERLMDVGREHSELTREWQRHVRYRSSWLMKWATTYSL